MIEINFGMALDGARWTEEAASLGKMTCGPLGMLKFLETRLGLVGPEMHQAERIGAYLEKVRAVYGTVPNAWGAASFWKDPWTTAKRLLALRDELIAAGWDGHCGGSERLDVLARIEATGAATPMGLADRVERVVAACTKENLAGVEIRVVDNLATYPRNWRRFFEKLGISSSTKEQKLPSVLVEGKPRVVEVVAANEIQLAGLFVRELKARLQDRKRVAVIAEAGTGLLDEFLHRAGLPSIGLGQSGIERAALQILPLWLEYMWEPFAPMTLLSILKSPVSPIPRKIAQSIVRALREEPGIGGEKWTAAWTELGPDAADCRKMLEAPRFDPEGDGIPYDAFAERIDWLIAKLARKVAPDYTYLDESVKGELAGTVRNAKLLKKLARPVARIDRVTLRRLLESIVATGSSRPDARPEVAPWRTYRNPGQVMTACECVLWWNFCESGSATSTYWTEAERLALEKDVEFDSENAVAREVDGWYNALKMAGGELRLYRPLTMSGAECGAHPFRADLVRHKYLKDEDAVVRDDDAEISAVIRKTDTSEDESDVARVPADRELSPESVSATQLTGLLTCPYRWYLERHLKLREPDELTLPTGAIMVGTLAHKVVEMIIQQKKEAQPDEAGSLAVRLFDELVPQMAAELLAPDRVAERESQRMTLKESVETLWSEIRKRHLKIVASEKDLGRKGAFHGLDFSGRADIVLEDEAGRPYVIDLKWSSSNRYAESATAGQSVQLATYAWAIDPVGMDVKSAYYMFPQKRFFESTQDDRDVWGKIERDYVRTLEEMKRGELHRGYVEGETELGLEQDCRYCPVKGLCGKECV